jgi:hypothetical protein
MAKDQIETKREETGTENFKGGMVLVQFSARLVSKKNIYLLFTFQAYVTSVSEALNTESQNVDGSANNTSVIMWKEEIMT